MRKTSVKQIFFRNKLSRQGLEQERKKRKKERRREKRKKKKVKRKRKRKKRKEKKEEEGIKGADSCKKPSVRRKGKGRKGWRFKDDEHSIPSLLSLSFPSFFFFLSLPSFSFFLTLFLPLSLPFSLSFSFFPSFSHKQRVSPFPGEIPSLLKWIQERKHIRCSFSVRQNFPFSSLGSRTQITQSEKEFEVE